MRVLIVDDERIEREGIRYLIEEHFKFETVEAANGKAALRVLEQTPAEILLTDIKMPFMDGLELIREARKRFPDMEIIVFSAYGEFEYARQAMQYGVDSYLLKPVDIEEFRQTVEQALKKLAERVREADLDAEVRHHHIMKTERQVGRRFTNALLCAERREALEYLREGIDIKGAVVPIILVTRGGLMMERLVEVDAALCALETEARQKSFFEERRCYSLLELSGGWDEERWRELERKMPAFLERIGALLEGETYVMLGDAAGTPEQPLDGFHRLSKLTDAAFYEWEDHVLELNRLCPAEPRNQAWALAGKLRDVDGTP